MHQDERWKQARLDGKAIRKETTDVIKYASNVRGIIDINHNFISNE